MTSKISLFSVMKEDLRHRLWMIALSCLGSFLALPTAFLLTDFLLIQRTYQEVTEISNFTEAKKAQLMHSQYIDFFNSEAMVASSIVLFLGALIVGIWGYRFLYSKKMVDLFHSTSIKRSQRFLAHYLNGLLIWLLPFLICILCTLILCFINLKNPIYFVSLIAAAGKTVLLCLFTFLMIYHLCLVAVMISGNAFNAIIATFIMGVGSSCIYGLIYFLFESCLENFLKISIVKESIFWTSPIIAAFFIAANNSNAFMIIASFILLILNIYIAWKLYLVRPSEVAEQGMQNKWFQSFLRLLETYIIGLGGSALFILILGTKSSAGWCFFGTVLGSILTFGILNIIFHMNFKTFFYHKLQLTLVTLFTLLTVFSIYFDWIGFNTRIPEKEQIESASIFFNLYTDNSYDITIDKNGSLIKNNTNFPDYDMEYKDADVIYSLLDTLANKNRQLNSDYNSSTAYVKINLKNGQSFYRSYQTTSADADVMKPIIESEAYKSTHYPLSSGKFPDPDSIEILDASNSISRHMTNKNQIKEFIMLYEKDFNIHYKMENFNNHLAICTLTVIYDSPSYGYHSYNLPVFDNYSNTLKALEELYPGMILGIENTDISKINFEFSLIASEKSDSFRNTLYSYFELEGYPSYSEHFENIAKDSYNTYDLRFSKSIIDETEIQELSSILKIGTQYHSFDSGSYIYAGTIQLSDGNKVDCFVEPGKMPRKFIDALQLDSNY